MPSIWAEESYRRIQIAEAPAEIVEFQEYYTSLNGGAAPNWTSFDVLHAPRNLVQHLAVCCGVFTKSDARLPDHYTYSIVGRQVEFLVGTPMEGLRVGHVMSARRRNSLLEEVRDMHQTGRPVFSESILDIRSRPEIGFWRGLFPFAAADGRPKKMILLLLRRSETPMS